MSAVNITKPQLIEKTGKDIIVTFSRDKVQIEHDGIVNDAVYGDMAGLVDKVNADIHAKNAPAPKSAAAVGVRMPPPPPSEELQAVSGDNAVVGNTVEGVVGGKRRRKTNKRARKGKRGTRRHY